MCSVYGLVGHTLNVLVEVIEHLLGQRKARDLSHLPTSDVILHRVPSNAT